MHSILVLVVILSLTLIALASAYPFPSTAQKVVPSIARFTPIVPFFMPPQNISNANGPAAALQGPTPPNTTGASPPPALQPQANAAAKSVAAPAPGFLSMGTINSLIRTPTSNWIATGNWSMTVDNGTLAGFTTNMTWFNSNGKTSHTHEFSNLRAGAGTMQGSNIVINGRMDVGTNHRVVWKNVPTTISIQGGKTITVSVDDNATNHHFAGQPVFGVVTSFVPCSDVPGANMEVLPTCQK
jgi:hypothetical protein